MEDKTIVCKDCGKEFVWTVGEQEFYKLKNIQNEPQRCKECRDKRKNNFHSGSNGNRSFRKFDR